MVTLSSPQWVKSNWASRPGGCTWGKYTSRSGPCSARQSCNRRCSVRNWAVLNRPVCCSASQSIIVVAFSLPVGSFRSRGSISSSHTPSKGSDRVRHRCSGFACDGNGPLCHLRAERTLIPALAAAVSCVLPSIRFCLNSLVCRSVINGTSVPNDYPISTGKNSRRYRQD